MKRAMFAILLNVFGVLALCSFAVSQTTVKGNIIDNNGKPVKGVVVKIKGYDIETLSAEDGSFSLLSPRKSGKVQFFSLGNKIKERSFNQNGMLNISLNSLYKLTDSPVSNGYGSQQQRDILGSSNSIESKNLPSAGDVREQLQGRFPGVIVTNTAGGFRVRIRGINSFNSNNSISTTEPLYIVDGLPMADISTLNPNDIKTISVLKDASETSIYGTRGANGVVIITTKK